MPGDARQPGCYALARHLFVYEGHPAVPLWTWDEDAPRIRDDRSYFARSHVNDSFPARGATEWQHALGQVVTAVVTAGMELLSLAGSPGAVLAARRHPRGSLGRTAAQRLQPARPPPGHLTWRQFPSCGATASSWARSWRDDGAVWAFAARDRDTAPGW